MSSAMGELPSSSWSSQIDNLSSFARQLSASPENVVLRQTFLWKLDMLKRSVQRPIDMLDENWAVMSFVNATVALLDHGVLQRIPAHGFISAGELAAEKAFSAGGSDASIGDTAAAAAVARPPLDKQTIVRLMRHLTAQGVVALGSEIEPTYAHTHLSRIWLQRTAASHSLMMVQDVLFPDLGLYLRTHAACDIENPSHCPVAWAAGLEGENFWEYLSRDPQKLATFDEALQFPQQYNPAFGTYPIAKRLAESNENGEQAVLVVDIGGGRGQSLVLLREKNPGLRGRFICQDRADVLASIPTVHGEMFEKMEHDFFMVQPVKGARIYYLRWIIHDWDDKSCVKILKQLPPAMSSTSRVLIHDALLPDRAVPGTDLSVLWMDYSVMMLGGKERTEAEMIALLRKAGLEYIKTWRSDSCAYSIVEAGLPGVE